jgi:hypothetical protein
LGTRAIQLHKLSSNHFLASREGIELGCVVGLLQNLLSFLILMHDEKNALKAFYDGFR